jgi:hypothetical protein
MKGCRFDPRNTTSTTVRPSNIIRCDDYFCWVLDGILLGK